MNKITTVIFDMDGLLADTEKICYQIDRDFISKYGYDMSLETYLKNHSGRSWQENVRRMLQTYKIPLSLEEGISFINARESYYLKQGVALKAGAKELLKYLKENEYIIVLATSSLRERAYSILNGNGVWEYFDAYVFGDEVEHGKPAPDIFIKASEKVSQHRDNCLVLEDSLMGVTAAYRAGIPVICIPDCGEPAREIYDMAENVCLSLCDVLDCICNSPRVGVCGHEGSSKYTNTRKNSFTN